jgi:hypothetical protein
MSSSGHVLTLAGLLFGLTAAAAISPLLDDIIRGLTLGGGLGTLIAYRRYQRTRHDPFIFIVRWTMVGAAFGLLWALISALR